MFTINNILRENIKKAKPYSSARDEYKGNEGVFLDANENAIGSATKTNYNRYPDPLQLEVKKKLAVIKGVAVENIFLGNGSDEPIDLLYRAVCNPKVDNVITMPPTYGMYEVSASINDIAIKEVPLNDSFDIQLEEVIKAIDKQTKIIFVCSPNNPTGNILNTQAIEKLLTVFNGIVVIDEAYIDFAAEKTFLPKLAKYPNLVILQTFSKAWGMAALRLGMAYASKEIIDVMNKIKPPYNINQVTQELALEALSNSAKKDKMVAELVEQKVFLEKEFKAISFIEKVYPSDANFILIKSGDGKSVYDYLVSNKIITRDRSKVRLCAGCVRISVGTKSENEILLSTLKKYSPKA